MSKNIHITTAMNQCKFDRRDSIGDQDELLGCSNPVSLEEWADYYYSHGYPEQHINQMGRVMHKYLQRDVVRDIRSITEEDCREHIKNIVLTKAFKKHEARYKILSYELAKRTGISFRFLPHYPRDWHLKQYMIDYYYRDPFHNRIIGIKVAPLSMQSSSKPSIVAALRSIARMHQQAMRTIEGNFFILFYSGKGIAVKIHNYDIIDKIKESYS